MVNIKKLGDEIIQHLESLGAGEIYVKYGQDPWDNNEYDITYAFHSKNPWGKFEDYRISIDLTDNPKRIPILAYVKTEQRRYQVNRWEFPDFSRKTIQKVFEYINRAIKDTQNFPDNVNRGKL